MRERDASFRSGGEVGENEEGFDIRIGGHGDSSEYEDSIDYDRHSCEGNEEQGVD